MTSILGTNVVHRAPLSHTKVPERNPDYRSSRTTRGNACSYRPADNSPPFSLGFLVSLQVLIKLVGQDLYPFVNTYQDVMVVVRQPLSRVCAHLAHHHGQNLE